jgi:hypothetical protein
MGAFGGAIFTENSLAKAHYTINILLQKKVNTSEMNTYNTELASQTGMGTPSIRSEEKKPWTKPALERFDIGSVTQNGGMRPYDDGDHAPAMS